MNEARDHFLQCSQQGLCAMFRPFSTASWLHGQLVRRVLTHVTYITSSGAVNLASVPKV